MLDLDEMRRIARKVEIGSSSGINEALKHFGTLVERVAQLQAEVEELQAERDASEAEVNRLMEEWP